MNHGLYAQTFRMASQGMLIVDASGAVLDANPAARKLLGVGPSGRLGYVEDWMDGACANNGNSLAQARISGERLLCNAPKPRNRRNGPFPLLIEPLAQSPVDRLVAFATQDPVTRLYNSETFGDMLPDWIDELAEAPEAGLLVVHLDRFGLVAEALGHVVGDNLLRLVARHLREIVGPCALMCRLHGAVFAIASSSVDVLAPRIHAALRRTFTWEDRSFDFSASVGIAPISGDTDFGLLLSAAERAARLAREEGGGRTKIHTENLERAFRDQTELLADLRHALAAGELQLHYQPKVGWPDGTVHGLEALVRWTHPRKGAISPGRFIPLAERYGLIVPLGRWVIREACRQISCWRDAGFEPPPVAVNVSPTQLLEQGVEDLLCPIAEFGIPQGLIEIEITETSMMDALQNKEGLLGQLRACGIKVAIDDFGTGHSSLSSLRRLPINVLKIDKSFIDDLTTSVEAREIVSTIIAMAKAMSFQIVAEGVETEDQATMLSSLGVIVMQGYHFSPAVPAEVIETWFARK